MTLNSPSKLNPPPPKLHPRHANSIHPIQTQSRGRKAALIGYPHSWLRPSAVSVRATAVLRRSHEPRHRSLAAVGLRLEWRCGDGRKIGADAGPGPKRAQRGTVTLTHEPKCWIGSHSPMDTGDEAFELMGTMPVTPASGVDFGVKAHTGRGPQVPCRWAFEVSEGDGGQSPSVS